MRTTSIRHFGAPGIGTALALVTAALAATLGGCGLANSGITVVGANPGTTSVPISVVAQSTYTRGSTSATTAAAKGSCTAAELRLGVEALAPTTSMTSTPSATPPVTTTPTTTTTTTSTAAPKTSSRGTAAATRREQLTLDFTNTSASPCELRGYPDVDFLRAGAGGPLSEPDTFSVARAVTHVELAPGGTAIATAAFVTNDPRNADGSGCDDAVAVRTFLPGSPKAISSGIRDANGAPLRHFFVCGHGIVVSALQT